MAKKILIGSVVVIVLLVAVIALQKEDFSIVRTATINASPAEVYPHLADLTKWESWSPWAKLDPAMKGTYEGTPGAEGSSHSWSGNDKVGEGKMTVTKLTPNELVELRLDFIKPMQATNMTQLTLKPEANLTVVTWTMTGKNNFVGKAFGLFMNMDKMVGGDFEKGLAQLKAEVEAETKKTNQG